MRSSWLVLGTIGLLCDATLACSGDARIANLIDPQADAIAHAEPGARDAPSGSVASGASVFRDAGADGATGNPGDASTSLDAAAGDARSVSDAGFGLSAQRVAAIRACMAARWGASPTRAAGDVSDDFDACTTTAESAGATGNENFAVVLTGWAEPDPADHSRLRRVATRDS